MFKAIESFVDLQDNNRQYHPGDIFPRDGLKVSESRLADLASGSNRRGRPVIAMIEQPVGTPENTPAEDKKKPVRKAAKKTATTRKRKNAD